MTDLEKAKMLIKRAVMNGADEAEFSVEEFSKRSVERLVSAMSEARKKAKLDLAGA